MSFDNRYYENHILEMNFEITYHDKNFYSVEDVLDIIDYGNRIGKGEIIVPKEWELTDEIILYVNSKDPIVFKEMTFSINEIHKMMDDNFSEHWDLKSTLENKFFYYIERYGLIPKYQSTKDGIITYDLHELTRHLDGRLRPDEENLFQKNHHSIPSSRI